MGVRGIDVLYGRDPSATSRCAESKPSIGGSRIGSRRSLNAKVRCASSISSARPANSRAVGRRIGARLADLDPALAEALSRRYKIELSGVPHGRIAERCMHELLARADAEFEWLA